MCHVRNLFIFFYNYFYNNYTYYWDEVILWRTGPLRRGTNKTTLRGFHFFLFPNHRVNIRQSHVCFCSYAWILFHFVFLVNFIFSFRLPFVIRKLHCIWTTRPKYPFLVKRRFRRTACYLNLEIAHTMFRRWKLLL